MKNKILMVSCEGLGNGGVQNVIMNIVREMSCKYDFDILLFTDEKRHYDEEFLKYGRIYRIPNKKSKIDYYIRFFRILIGTYKILKNENYQAIHCNNQFESGICILAAKMANVPIRIVHTHVIINEKKSNAVRKIINSFYLLLINRLSNCKIGCSKMAVETFFKECTSAKVVLNPIDLNKFDYRKYEKKDDRNVNFIHIGSFCDNKNQEFILNVFYEIKKQISNIHLNLIGFGEEYKKRLEEKIEKLNLDDNVEILPSNSDVPYYLSVSDYMIFPSKSEGFGIAVLEAQSMGVKCFISSVVPQEVNAGNCEVFDLKWGETEWAKRIIEHIKNEKDKHFVDMNEYDIKNIRSKYELIYDRRNYE